MENVRDNWQQVTSMTGAEILASIQDATGALMTSLDNLRSGDVKKEEMDVFEFTEKDTILYALGSG